MKQKKKAKDDREAVSEALEKAEENKRTEAEVKNKAWEMRKDNLERELRGIQS